jgi:ubiquinone biosynthesis protein
MIHPGKKIQRASQIIGVLARFGFRDILMRLPWSEEYKILHDKKIQESALEKNSIYVRIRMALEELGPAFVKLGQAATTREGLLPDALVAELKLLEDKVECQALDVKDFLQQRLGAQYDQHIAWVDEQPFASASISQVYHARLHSGDQVVIKVRRPDIEEILLTDLALMKDLANIMANNIEAIRQINLPLIVDSFANTLSEEISLTNERTNIERFALNFADNEKIYVPKVYPHLCTNEILCMEFVQGTKVTDVDRLIEEGADLKQIVRNGLNLYLEQVLLHGFFHGDPHPGNLMVLPDNKIAFIDFGNMGRLLPSDKEDFETFILASIDQDSKYLSEIIENIALYSHITDRPRYERSLNELFEIMTTVSLGTLDLEAILSKVWRIIGDNQIHFPEYIYQLIRGISLIEGIGKKLDPELNILAAIKPFSTRIIAQRLNPGEIANRRMRKIRTAGRQLEQLPSDLREIIRQVKKGDLVFNHQVRDLTLLSRQFSKGSSKVSLSIMFLALLILAGSIILANPTPAILGIPVWAAIFLFFAGITALMLFYLILRK